MKNWMSNFWINILASVVVSVLTCYVMNYGTDCNREEVQSVTTLKASGFKNKQISSIWSKTLKVTPNCFDKNMFSKIVAYFETKSKGVKISRGGRVRWYSFIDRTGKEFVAEYTTRGKNKYLNIQSVCAANVKCDFGYEITQSGLIVPTVFLISGPIKGCCENRLYSHSHVVDNFLDFLKSIK